MTEYCRLCAELKDPMEIVASIDDVEQLMEQKLWACCQWTTENSEQRLPHSVCSDCLDKLDKCWLFSQSVQLAQQRLLEIFENETEIETKPSVTVIVPQTYDALEYSNNNLPLPPVSIPFETPASELYYSEYYTIDTDANGQRVEINDLNEDTYAEYIEDDKNDIVLIEEQDNTNDVPKTAQVEIYPELKCRDCGQQFSSKSNLKRHRSIHTGVQPYECWLCHKMFRLKIYLSEHMLIHTYTADKRIKHATSNRWKRAKRITSRKNAKNKTTYIECDPKACRFPCNECGRAFARKYQLIKHCAVHTTDQPYQCECGRRYKYKSNLYLHRKRSNHSIEDDHELSDIENSLDYKLSALFSMILTGEKEDEEVNDKRSISRISNGLSQCPPFRCDECCKEFTLPRGLVKHRRLVHTLEQPIECKHCGKFFKHENSLRRHCQLFSIEYPLNSNSNRFSCPECDRTFVRKSWLLKHRQSHINTERPHQTVEYGPVKEEFSLAAHHLEQSNERQFECWLCHEMFESRSFLEKHFAIHMLSPEIRRLKAEIIYHHC